LEPVREDLREAEAEAELTPHREFGQDGRTQLGGQALPAEIVAAQLRGGSFTVRGVAARLAASFHRRSARTGQRAAGASRSVKGLLWIR
jgi:hypothetical protein